jgi:ribosomal protein L37AE/L43A
MWPLMRWSPRAPPVVRDLKCPHCGCTRNLELRWGYLWACQLCGMVFKLEKVGA